MKIKLFVIVIVIINLFSCESSNSDYLSSNDYHIISDSLDKIITEDAVHLTLKILREDESYNDKIELPDEIFLPIYNGLIELYKADDPVLDTILRITPIHCHPSPYTKKLLIYTELDVDWVQSWYEDSVITDTGISELDNLIERTNAELWLVRPYMDEYLIIIDFPEYWNLIALAEAFSKIEGIKGADLSVFVIHSVAFYDIDIIMNSEGIYLTFILKTECDFMGACANKYTWEVFISNTTGKYEIIR